MRWRSFADTRYFEGICLGIFLFAVFASATVVIIHYDSGKIADLENYFFGAIAIGAALFSVKTVKRQILQQIEADEEEVKRKRRVKQVALTLVSVRFSTGVNQVIKWHLDPTVGTPPDTEYFDPLVKELSDFCEFASEAEFKFIASLLTVFQVLTSRLESNAIALPSDYNDPNPVFHRLARMTFDTEALNWAVLAVMMGQVLQWSRNPQVGMGQPVVACDQLSRRIDDAWMVPNSVSSAPPSVGRIEEILKKRSEEGRVTPSWMHTHGIGR
ncbi:hypothetical protein [uncultured Roseobacter sp.]|uniref:hypothetical protein n=1 Tax=uncultured Roseobacter sp. TaxID=114847 RepID=UPI00262BDDEC|nr:hypothetical protein [uncultured Roseobacter sp.]